MLIGSLLTLRRRAKSGRRSAELHLQPHDQSEIPSGRLTFRDLAPVTSTIACRTWRNHAAHGAACDRALPDPTLGRPFGFGDSATRNRAVAAFLAAGQPHQGQAPPGDVDRLQQGAEVWTAAARGVLPSGSLGRTDGTVAVQTGQGGSGTAGRILERLSGAELALTLLVAATGLRISEALGLQWQDVDYEARQINLRRVWVGNRAFERLKTERSEAPVPLTDLLADCSARLARRNRVRASELIGSSPASAPRAKTTIGEHSHG